MRRERKVFGAREKAEAVLSVWSGRRGPGAASRALGISQTLLGNWERRALEGMMRGLGVEVGEVPNPEGTLGKRLERLLAQGEREALGPAAGASESGVTSTGG